MHTHPHTYPPIKSGADDMTEVTLTEFPGNSSVLLYHWYQERSSQPQQYWIYSNPLLQSIYFHFLYSWIRQMHLLQYSFFKDLVFKNTRCKNWSSASNSPAQKFLASYLLLPCSPVPFERALLFFFTPPASKKQPRNANTVWSSQSGC